MKKILIILLSFLFSIELLSHLDACALMMNSNKQGTFVGRTMEWFGPIKPIITIYPRNLPDSNNNSTLQWVSKYGIVTIEDRESNGNTIVIEGINKKGLTAHLLVQEDASMPELDPDKPTIDFSVWVKYVLARNATVKEVLEDLNNYQILLREAEYDGTLMECPEHYIVMDANGDSAIIEFNDGKMEIFHGKQYNVVTNAPNLHDQLENLRDIKENKKQYSVANLPGGANSRNRFVRASFYMETMPEPDSSARAVAYMSEAVDGISNPSFDLNKEPKNVLTSCSDYLIELALDLPHGILDDAWEARWRVVYDLKNMNFYFNETSSGKKIYMKLNEIDYNVDTIRSIDIQNIKSEYNL